MFIYNLCFGLSRLYTNIQQDQKAKLDYHMSMLFAYMAGGEGVGKMFCQRGSEFLCPATKSGGVLCYTLRSFECLSIRLSVRPSVRPSAVDHSCPLHNFDTVRDNFMKLGTNIKHDQTTCRD